MTTKATQRTRPWRHGFAAVLWLWLVLPSAQAVVKVHESLEYYDVPAGAGLDLRMQMRQASPILRRGQVYFGNTEWHVEPNFGYQEYQGLCRISQVQVELNIKIVLPKLDDDGSVTPLDKTRFQQFSQALMQHEQGHKALGLEAAQEIDTLLTTMVPFAYCEQLQNQARRRVANVIKKYQQLNQQYDQETQFGRTQGAVIR